MTWRLKNQRLPLQLLHGVEQLCLSLRTGIVQGYHLYKLLPTILFFFSCQLVLDVPSSPTHTYPRTDGTVFMSGCHLHH
uniref:Uncharacterized protein n=1 Tax=Timema poppense TaxID=170557 RepID=A0A7R9DR34_TIMPO|nr:unnamed protein product [Timema poppensis]